MLPIHLAKGGSLSSVIAGMRSEENQISQEVASIIERVRSEGDTALINYTKKLDNFAVNSIGKLIAGPNEFDQARAELPDDQLKLLKETIKRIEYFHHHQLEQGFFYSDEFGNKLGQKVSPLARAGSYTPGGKAAYPS